MPSRPSLHRLFLFVTLGGLTVWPVAAQQHRMLPLDHWAYEYIHRLQARGYLLDLHPTALPYTTGEVAGSVRHVDRDDLDPLVARWVDRLREEFDRRDGEEASRIRGEVDRRERDSRIGRGERRKRGTRRHRGFVERQPEADDPGRRMATIGAVLQPGIRLSSTPGLDPLRPRAGESPSLRAGDLGVYPQAAGRLFMEYGPFVAQLGLRFDMFYRDDPEGLDAANRLITRNEDAYVGAGSRYASVYLGRIGNHWAPSGAAALLVSDNPVEVDQIHIRLGGRGLALRSIVGELDSMTDDGRFTGTAGADSVEASVRRFVSAHRLDWRPSRYVALSIMESTIYSGRHTGFSLKFLNPLALHLFAVDGRPKNDENNGLLAGMLWAQAGAWTLHGQLLVDDVDLMNATGEPPALALSGNLTFAGLSRLDAGVELTAVAARTYNTHQPEGRYTHLLRGIGAPFNDYVRAGVSTTLYAGRGPIDAAITPRIDALFQGEARVHQPYPASADQADFILDGTVERVIRPALQIRLQGRRSWWFQADAGPAFIVNEGHVPSADRGSLTLSAALFVRLSVTEAASSTF